MVEANCAKKFKYDREKKQVLLVQQRLCDNLELIYVSDCNYYPYYFASKELMNFNYYLVTHLDYFCVRTTQHLKSIETANKFIVLGVVSKTC